MFNGNNLPNELLLKSKTQKTKLRNALIIKCQLI